MSTPRQYLVGAIITALAIPVAVAGCSTQPSDDEVTSSMSDAIVSQVPHVRGVLVDLGQDGTSRVVIVRLFLDDAQQSTLTTVVEKVVGIAWRSTPTDPSSVIVSAVDGPKPGGATTSDVGGIDLTATASALGFTEPAVDLSRLSVGESELVAHYGPWSSK